MKFHQAAAVLALILFCGASLASASLNIRGSSGNGTDSNAVDWLLIGRSTGVKYSANGKNATITREVVCTSQDVEASFFSPTQTLAGSCDSGNYMFLFQVQSTSVNVNVVINKLLGFNSLDTTAYGAMICDNTSANSIEMCTTATQSQIPSNITATVGKTSVTFTVPNTFPSYPAGTAQQGQGLTFYVITKQASPLPISMPTVGIK